MEPQFTHSRLSDRSSSSSAGDTPVSPAAPARPGLRGACGSGAGPAQPLPALLGAGSGSTPAMPRPPAAPVPDPKDGSAWPGAGSGLCSPGVRPAPAFHLIRINPDLPSGGCCRQGRGPMASLHSRFYFSCFCVRRSNKSKRCCRSRERGVVLVWVFCPLCKQIKAGGLSQGPAIPLWGITANWGGEGCPCQAGKSCVQGGARWTPCA